MSSTRTPSADGAGDRVGISQDGRTAKQVGVERRVSTHLVAIQRARMVMAMTEAAAELGTPNVTVGHVVARGGVSRRTFYEIFSDREDCLLVTLDSAIAQASEPVLNAYDPSLKWVDRIRSALTALLGFLDEHPAAGRLVIVESLAAGPNALQLRVRVLTQVVTAIDLGRGERRNGALPPPLAAEGIVGAVLSVIHTRIVQGAPEPLVELTSPLMSTIVLPYLGEGAAKRELARPIPVQNRAKTPASEALKDLEMRLTYRTLRVLLAIGAKPGASNRQIGEASGVEDQGQISKLLARLERIGMIENTGIGPNKGAPNAWTLTKRGQEIQNAIATTNTRT